MAPSKITSRTAPLTVEPGPWAAPGGKQKYAGASKRPEPRSISPSSRTSSWSALWRSREFVLQPGGRRTSIVLAPVAGSSARMQAASPGAVSRSRPGRRSLLGPTEARSKRWATPTERPEAPEQPGIIVGASRLRWRFGQAFRTTRRKRNWRPRPTTQRSIPPTCVHGPRVSYAPLERPPWRRERPRMP